MMKPAVLATARPGRPTHAFPLSGVEGDSPAATVHVVPEAPGRGRSLGKAPAYAALRRAELRRDDVSGGVNPIAHTTSPAAAMGGVSGPCSWRQPA